MELVFHPPCNKVWPADKSKRHEKCLVDESFFNRRLEIGSNALEKTRSLGGCSSSICSRPEVSCEDTSAGLLQVLLDEFVDLVDECFGFVFSCFGDVWNARHLLQFFRSSGRYFKHNVQKIVAIVLHLQAAANRNAGCVVCSHDVVLMNAGVVWDCGFTELNLIIG